MTREPVYAAVFAFFAALTQGGAPLFRLATRKAEHWDQAAAEDSPCLFMRQRTENASRVKGRPTIWRLSVDLLLYARTNAQNDPDVVPAQVLNPLLDAIEAALTPDDPMNDACTLGGLVSHAAIEGTVEIFEGTQGDEAVAVVPLTLVLAS